MRLKFLLVLGIFLLSACAETVTEDAKPESSSTTSEAVSTNVMGDAQESETKSEPKAVVKSAEEVEAERIAAAKEEAAKIAKESKEKLNALKNEFAEASTQWREKMKNAKTREQRTEAVKINPANEFGQRFLDLAEACPDPQTSAAALTQAMINGVGPAKTTAMNKMLTKAETDIESQEAMGTFILLTQFGSGEPKNAAMSHLLAKAEKDLDSEESRRLLVQLINTRGEAEPKDKACKLLLKLTETDIRSNQAAHSLAMIATQAKGESKPAAMSWLIEHHINSDKMIEVMKPMARLPNQKNEDWLKEIYRKGAGKVKGNALVSLAKLAARRDKLGGYYSSASEEIIESLGEEQFAYLTRERDSNEAIEIEKMLDAFVTDHESLLESAKRELFAIRNLSVGKTAPEIVGTDLDGVEFKLSDYRGKVVFLDFWGDW